MNLIFIIVKKVMQRFISERYKNILTDNKITIKSLDDVKNNKKKIYYRNKNLINFYRNVAKNKKLFDIYSNISIYTFIEPIHSNNFKYSIFWIKFFTYYNYFYYSSINDDFYNYKIENIENYFLKNNLVDREIFQYILNSDFPNFVYYNFYYKKNIINKY